MIHQIKKLEPVIEKLLENKKSLRDNDNALYANLIYSMDSKLKDNASANYLLSMIANNSYPAMESVTRARRKVQERREDLRGDRYSARKVNEQEVREGINK